MSQKLERRLARMEAKRSAERGIGKRIKRMTDAELTAAIGHATPNLRPS